MATTNEAVLYYFLHTNYSAGNSTGNLQARLGLLRSYGEPIAIRLSQMAYTVVRGRHKSLIKGAESLSKSTSNHLLSLMKAANHSGSKHKHFSHKFVSDGHNHQVVVAKDDVFLALLQAANIIMDNQSLYHTAIAVMTQNIAIAKELS